MFKIRGKNTKIFLITKYYSEKNKIKTKIQNILYLEITIEK